MLNYQTAKDLFEEIQTAPNPIIDDTLVDDYVHLAVDYVHFLSSEYLKREERKKANREFDDFQMSIVEDTKRTIEKDLIMRIKAIGLFLNISTITKVLTDDTDRLDFAKYVAMFKI